MTNKMLYATLTAIGWFCVIAGVYFTYTGFFGV